MKSKRGKAVVYPYGMEIAPIVRHRELLNDYEIVSLISPRGWGLVGKDAGQADKGDNVGLTVECDLDEALENSENLIVADCSVVEKYKEKIFTNIDLAIRKGKNIICTLPLDLDKYFDLNKKCKQQGLEFKYYKNMQISEYDGENLLDIGVPVVFVAGLTQQTNKFEIQLSIRESLIQMGYKVSQIGSRNYCELMGFHSIPLFMFDNKISEVKKIVQFNRFIKELEILEKPDIIVIGIPGGLMPFNKDLTNMFGVSAFLISQAVSPDYSIISVLYDDVDLKYFEMLDTSFKYKYGFSTDAYIMSTSQFDYVNSKDQGKLCFNYLDTCSVSKIINSKYKSSSIPIFNIFNSHDSKNVSEMMVNTLNGFSVREQMNVGGLV